MSESKKYTLEQMKNAEEAARLLGSLPPESQSTVAMVTNAFIAGMAAQRELQERSAVAAT